MYIGTYISSEVQKNVSLLPCAVEVSLLCSTILMATVIDIRKLAM